MLRETGADTLFLYDERWTQDVACALPVQTRDHYWRGGLLPFFEHLGSEGWLRGRQARAGGTQGQDDFGLLLNYGADCIGAIGILPEDGVPHQIAGTDGSRVDEAAAAPGRTLSGVQKKLLAYHDKDGFHPTVSAEHPATHIAKFNREDLPTLVQNEDLSLRLARDVLGSDEVTAARPAVLKDAGDEGIALLVERFDRADGEKLRLEDFAQILGRPRGREFDGKYASSYEEAATAITRYSARAQIDLRRYFKLVLFSFVIGNADAHLKNFSLLERPEGLRLSPAYDLVNTLVIGKFEPIVALEIGGRKRDFEEVDHALVTQLGLDIGLPDSAVRLALEELRASFAKAPSLVFPNRIEPDDFRLAYRDIVENHAQRILS